MSEPARKARSTSSRDAASSEMLADPVAEAVDLLMEPLPEKEPDRSREALRRAESAARVLAAAAEAVP